MFEPSRVLVDQACTAARAAASSAGCAEGRAWCGGKGSANFSGRASPDRRAAAIFGQGHDVGRDAEMLVGEQLAGAPKPV